MSDEPIVAEAVEPVAEAAVAADVAPAKRAEPSKTLATGGGDGEPKDVPADWPADWRDKLASGDEKLAKRLARFQSPGNVLKSWLALEQRLSSGELKAPPPADDENALKAWRADNGIPETATGYLDNLPDGLIIGDDDKTYVAGFAEKMHAQNVAPAVVHQAIAWWNAEKEAQAAKQVESDRAFKIEAEDALRAEWGGEFRANMNAITNFVKSAPDGVADLVMQSRDADGNALGNNPAVLKWLMSMSAELNPGGVIAPGDASSQMRTIDGRIAEIMEVMRTDRKKYDREGLDKELTRLYEAQEKVKSRAA